MAQDRHRRGHLLIAAGLGLAVASLVVMVAVQPDPGSEAGAFRSGAVLTFIAGVLVTVSGGLHHLPTPQRSPVWRSRGYGALVAATGCLFAVVGLLRDPDPDWLTAVGGTLMLVAGAGIIVAAQRSARPGRSS